MSELQTNAAPRREPAASERSTPVITRLADVPPSANAPGTMHDGRLALLQWVVLDQVPTERSAVSFSTLANRCRLSRPRVWKIVCELVRVGYVVAESDTGGRMRVWRCIVQKPISEPREPDPLWAHRRILTMLQHGPFSGYRLSAYCSEICPNERRQAMDELLKAGCIGRCRDEDGRPAFEIRDHDKAAAWLNQRRDK